VIGHRVVLRPRSFLDTGDLALVFVQRHAALFVRLLPWVVLPAAGCWALHAFASCPPYAALLIELLILSVTSGVYTILCGDLMLAPGASLRDVQKRFLRTHERLPESTESMPRTRTFYPFLRFIWARIVGAMVMCFTLTFLYGYVAFTPEGVLLEKGKTREVLSRSQALLGATGGRAVLMWVAIPMLLLFGAVGMELIRYSLRAMFALPVPTLSDLGTGLSWAPYLGAALIQPYIVVFRFLLYIDCRTRREGWDLQVQFSTLATQSLARTSSSRAA
jgi:hypothetical protein